MVNFSCGGGGLRFRCYAVENPASWFGNSSWFFRVLLDHHHLLARHSCSFHVTRKQHYFAHTRGRIVFLCYSQTTSGQVRFNALKVSFPSTAARWFEGQDPLYLLKCVRIPKIQMSRVRHDKHTTSRRAQDMILKFPLSLSQKKGNNCSEKQCSNRIYTLQSTHTRNPNPAP